MPVLRRVVSQVEEVTGEFGEGDVRKFTSRSGVFLNYYEVRVCFEGG